METQGSTNFGFCELTELFDQVKLRYAITKKDWSRFTRTTGNELYVRAFYQTPSQWQCFDVATINSKATSPLTPLLHQHFIRAVHLTLQIYEQTYHRNVRCVHVCRVETIHDEVVVRMPVVRLVCCRRCVMQWEETAEGRLSFLSYTSYNIFYIRQHLPLTL